jgi:penicillin-binding protein 1A
MKAHFKTFSKIFLILGSFFLGSVLLLTAGIYLYLSPKLPSPETLRSIKLQTPLQIYSADHKLMAQFGEKRRIPVERSDIPPDFINAILAAEDDNFYNHRGVDLPGLMRAAVELVLSGEIQSGGSTITMQLARNFFLSTEQSFIRKFNEILLALRIEDDFSKDDILTLYANKIYLGNRAYGIGAAAEVYYGATIDQLRLDQLAMIAGLPKAPSAFNPLANPVRATERRNWILNRMYKLDYIDRESLDTARATVDDSSYHSPRAEFYAPYASEMARQRIINSWGLDAYTDGYIVTTTIDSKLQTAANAAVRKGLEDYDWRHGYRGPEKNVADPDEWLEQLRLTSTVDNLLPAIITEIGPQKIKVLMKAGEQEEVELANNPLRLFIDENRRSATVKDFSELFVSGDLIRIRRHAEGYWQISQIPKVQAALVSLDPKDGAIKAVVGGYNFEISHFNRAEQAMRQPGSNFKPFIYTRALEKGMNGATLINDAPIVFRDPYLEKVWRPENDSGKFYGPTPLRTALYRSRNVVSIRLLRRIGINYAINGMSRFGFDESSLPKNLSLALGTQATTPLSIAQGYTLFANGGYKVEANMISRVEALDGEVIYEGHPATVCEDCDPSKSGESDSLSDNFDEADSLQELFDSADNASDRPKNPAERVVDARVAFIMDSILKDVIKKGTGRKALALKRGDIGGKTGTTNGPRDAWFSGYSPHLATSVWVGFDENLLLGKGEYGGSAALPIWMDYMAVALEGKPEIYRPTPPGLITMRINPYSGNRVGPGDPNGIFEYFMEGNRKNLPSTSTTISRPANDPVPEDLF